MSLTVLARATPPSAARSAAGDQIMAFVTDDLSGAALKAGIGDLAREFILRRGDILQATRYLERNPAPQALVVDISGIDEPLSALEALARVCPPDVTVVVVGDSTDIALYRDLVNDVGVADYLPKPLTRDTVARVLPRHFAAVGFKPVPRGGHVVAVCGASGGAGATTMAVSAAVELATGPKSKTLLLDLNLQHGAAALMMGARPGPGLRMVLEDPQSADTLLIERAAIEVGQRLRLIAADESLESEVRLTEAAILQVLNLVRQKFNYVVVDLPSPLPPELHQVLAIARHVLLVVTPDVVSVRNARKIRQLALKMAGSDRVLSIVNQANARGALPREMVEQALEAPVHVMVPQLGRKMLESVNLGIPSVQRVPELRRHFAPAVRELAALEAGSRHRSWLGRILDR